MLVSDLGYSDYLGRLAIGKVFNGKIVYHDGLICIDSEGKHVPLKVSKLQTYVGLKFIEINNAEPGDIVVLSGIENVKIGDTICNRNFPKALKRISVDEPTVSMKFTINTLSFLGKGG